MLVPHQWLPIHWRRDLSQRHSDFMLRSARTPDRLWNGHSLVSVPCPVNRGPQSASVRSTTPTTRPWVAWSATRGSEVVHPPRRPHERRGNNGFVAPDLIHPVPSTNLAGSPRWPGADPAWARRGNPAIAHSVALTGLGPAAFVHARAFSVLGSDTFRGERTLYSTASLQCPAECRWFNREVDTSVSQEHRRERAQQHHGQHRAYIDACLSTLDVARVQHQQLHDRGCGERCPGPRCRFGGVAEGATPTSP